MGRRRRKEPGVRAAASPPTCSYEVVAVVARTWSRRLAAIARWMDGGSDGRAASCRRPGAILQLPALATELYRTGLLALDELTDLTRRAGLRPRIPSYCTSYCPCTTTQVEGAGTTTDPLTCGSKATLMRAESATAAAAAAAAATSGASRCRGSSECEITGSENLALGSC